MTNHLLKRLNAVKSSLRNSQIDGYLFTDPQSIFYLTNIMPNNDPGRREAICLILGEKLFLRHSPLLAPTSHSHIISTVFSADLPLAKWLSSIAPNQVIGFDNTDLTVQEHDALQNHDYVLQPAHNPIKTLRAIKDNQEISSIQTACQASYKLAIWLQDFLKQTSSIGITEVQVANELKIQALKMGYGQMAFPPIIAFDEHSAIPHHTPTDKPLTQDSVVLFDFGVQAKHYTSDLTRTFKLGKQHAQFLKVKYVVDEAYQQAIHAMNSHISFYQLQQLVIDYFAANKLLQYFPHSLGHGIGLDIHESPIPAKSENKKLISNQVITIEPGLYIPGKFGYRLENTVLVTNSHPIELTNQL